MDVEAWAWPAEGSRQLTNAMNDPQLQQLYAAYKPMYQRCYHIDHKVKNKTAEHINEMATKHREMEILAQQARRRIEFLKLPQEVRADDSHGANQDDEARLFWETLDEDMEAQLEPSEHIKELESELAAIAWQNCEMGEKNSRCEALTTENKRLLELLHELKAEIRQKDKKIESMDKHVAVLEQPFHERVAFLLKQFDEINEQNIQSKKEETFWQRQALRMVEWNVELGKKSRLLRGMTCRLKHRHPRSL